MKQMKRIKEFEDFLSESSQIYFLVKNADTGKYEVRSGSKYDSTGKTGTHRFKTLKDAEEKANQLNESKHTGFFYKKGDELTIDMGDGPEKVVVDSNIKAGAGRYDFITLFRKKGAPYTLSLGKLNQVIVKEALTEASSVTPERMLRSIYDNLRDNASSVEVGPFNAQRGYFDFIMDDSIKGQIEARKGKILVSFSEIKINPKQYDLIYDGDVTLSKDHIRQQVSKILRDYANKLK